MIPLEQKIFEFMEKLYSEMQNGFATVNSRLDNLEEGQVRLEERQSNLENQFFRFENDLKPKVEAALDGYKYVSDKLEILETKVDKLTEIVADHDVEIQVIRKAK